jgi:hypothetical protein
VFEAPPGLKQNVQRTYALWSSDFLAGHVGSSTARRSSSGEGGDETRHSGSLARPVPPHLVPLRAQLLFLLAWFNAVLQERQNHVPVVSLCGQGDATKPRSCPVSRQTCVCVTSSDSQRVCTCVRVCAGLDNPVRLLCRRPAGGGRRGCSDGGGQRSCRA